MSRISCIEAVEKASARTWEALFKPFDFLKWIVFSFSVWLSTMGETLGKGISFTAFPNFGDFAKGAQHPGTTSQGMQKDIISDFLQGGIFASNIPGKGLGEIFNIKLVLILAAVFIAVFFLTMLILFILSWIKARFEFIFLDNILTGRPEIAKPWREYRSLGNSVFIFRFMLGAISLFVTLAALAAMFVLCFDWIKQCIGEKSVSYPEPGIAVGMAVCILIITVFAVFLTILSFLFKHFGIPLMYRQKRKSLSAIIEVYNLFRKHPWAFSKYVMLVCILNIVIKMLIALICICTCCTGFIIFAIPYISVLLVLPVLVFFRFFSLEFLAQLGGECNLFAEGGLK